MGVQIPVEMAVAYVKASKSPIGEPGTDVPPIEGAAILVHDVPDAFVTLFHVVIRIANLLFED